MSNSTTTDTQVNRSQQINSNQINIPNFGLPKADHCRLRARQHEAIRLKCKELGLSKNKEEYLHELLNCSNLMLATKVSQESMAERLRCSTKTIKRYEDEMVRRGLIKSQKNGWKQTNTKTLLVAQHLKHHKRDKMSPITKDLNINNINTYMDHDVDNFLNDLDRERAKPKPPPKPPRANKHINEQAIQDPKSQEAQQEIQRACAERKLTTEQSVLVLFMFQTAKGVTSKGGYLNAMMEGIRAGTWKQTNQTRHKTENKNLMYGFDKKQLEQKARAGETYWDVAQRLRKQTNVGVSYE